MSSSHGMADGSIIQGALLLNAPNTRSGGFLADELAFKSLTCRRDYQAAIVPAKPE